MSGRLASCVAVAVLISALLIGGGSPLAAQQSRASKRGESHLRSVRLPQIIPPELDDDRVTLKLPGAAAAIAVGGGGRYLILHLKSLRQAAVFDVNAGKVVKYLPLPSDDVALAAGAEHLIVVLRSEGIIQRWNLSTFERQFTKPLAMTPPVATVVMGSGSNGPIFLAAGDFYRNSQAFLDLDTLEPAAIETIEGHWRCSGAGDCVVRASADGRVFTMWRLGTSPSGLQDVVVSGNRATVRYEHESVGDILPNADGSRLYTGTGIFTSELRRVGTDRIAGGIPSLHGNFYLKATGGDDPRRGAMRAGGGSLTVHIAGDDRPVATIPNPLPARARLSSRRTPAAVAMLRHYFIPDADLVVSVPWTNDQLILQRFDLDEALERSGVDYLFVFSRPVVKAERGKTYEYPVKAKAKQGRVRVQVASGPDGMQVSPTGVVSWPVPEDLAEDKVDVILSLRDKSGQEVFQSYAIAVAGQLKPSPLASARPRETRSATSTPSVSPPHASRRNASPPEQPADQKAEAPPARKPEAAHVPSAKRPAPKPTASADDSSRRASKLPRIEPVKFEGDQLKVKLPGQFDEVAAAGRGRFLILHLKRLRQLAVFDVSLAQIVHYIPLSSDDVAFTAGSDRVIVALRDKKRLERWSLRTMKRELTVPNPTASTVFTLGMGCASEGPVAALVGSGGRPGAVMLLDGTSLEPLPVGADSHELFSRTRGVGTYLRVSANGRLFVSPGWSVIVQGGTVQKKTMKSSPTLNNPLPNADGTAVYSLAGMLDENLDPRSTQRPTAIPIPAVQPGYYLSLPISEINRRTSTTGASIHVDGDSRPLVRVNLPAGLSMDSELSVSAQLLRIDRRFWFVPDAHAIVQLPLSGDHLLVHKVDIEALLEKSGIDYLFVRSRPPLSASLGESLEYQLQVESKRGGVTCELTAGPEGMRVSPAGLVTWRVPADYDNSPVSVIVSVKDDSQQEVFHRFSLALPEAAKREAERLAAEAARREAEVQARREAAMAAQDRARLQTALARADAALAAANAGAEALRSGSRQAAGPRPPLAPTRIWTDSDGNQIEAALLEVFAGQANFQKPSRQMILVPLERLSGEDRRQVEQLAAAVVAERRRREAEENAGDAKIRAPLETIGMGLKAAVATGRGVFPPAHSADSDGKPLLSWRVHLLPYIGGRDLYRLFRLDQPWDSEHNRALLRYMPEVYRAFGSGAGEGKTNFLAVVGDDCLFTGASAVPLQRATDGLSNTAAIVEAPDRRAVEWTRPEDWRYEGPEVVSAMAGLRDGGFYVLLGDGAARWISTRNSVEMLDRLFTRSDGQPLQLESTAPSAAERPKPRETK